MEKSRNTAPPEPAHPSIPNLDRVQQARAPGPRNFHRGGRACSCAVLPPSPNDFKRRAKESRSVRQFVMRRRRGPIRFRNRHRGAFRRELGEPTEGLEVQGSKKVGACKSWLKSWAEYVNHRFSFFTKYGETACYYSISTIGAPPARRLKHQRRAWAKAATRLS